MLLYPFAEGGITKYNAHSGAVTCLISSADNKYVFSASEDGSLFIFKVSDERVNLDIQLVIRKIKDSTKMIS